eukprot:CAMPEP_0171576262 /NCGR_PEP_ID=MMETSP0961-20121227/6499_1 /TAXON_ID=87120 /ORGANISM="Aurantiochytrium limacinum, Strain ATCCMYA-1381" /LENGTH=45 /DNA_ID= /DNA_START= /DNA_END= /DNA_ORIENTATION=
MIRGNRSLLYPYWMRRPLNMQSIVGDKAKRLLSSSSMPAPSTTVL